MLYVCCADARISWPNNNKKKKKKNIKPIQQYALNQEKGESLGKGIEEKLKSNSQVKHERGEQS